MSNTLTTTANKFFSAINADGLNWEGFAESKEALQARFPEAIISEWQATEFPGIWML